MTHKANPVTLTLITCGEAATTTLGAKGPVKLKTPPAVRPVHLKNLHTEGVSKGDTATLSAVGAVAPLSEANTTCRHQAATTPTRQRRVPPRSRSRSRQQDQIVYSNGTMQKSREKWVCISHSLLYYNTCLITRYTSAPTAAVQGMVIIQADTIW